MPLEGVFLCYCCYLFSPLNFASIVSGVLSLKNIDGLQFLLITFELQAVKFLETHEISLFDWPILFEA